MAFIHSPKIVTEGLVLCLDAGNRKSYPGSGTTWLDLSENRISGTLTNGPTFSSTNGGSIVFDGTNDVVDCGTQSVLGFTNSVMTVNAWIYPTGFGGSSLGRILVRQYLLFVDNVNVTNGLTFQPVAGTFVTASNCITLNTWQHVGVTVNTTSVTIYVNGNVVLSQTAANPVGNSSAVFYVGNQAALNRTFAGNIASIHMYAKTLTATEILQNYNATRSRFGV